MVVAAAKDGKSLMVATAPQARGDEPTKTEIKLGDKTALVFMNVGPDGAKLAEGQEAHIWLENGSKDTAARVIVRAATPERATQVTGRVTAVGKDGWSFTLETQARGRAEEPKTLEVKINPGTRIAYFSVGPDEAKLVEGLLAQVRLEEGSANIAMQILFHKQGAERGGRRE